MLCTLLALAAPQVWDVDANGGGDFLDLPEAVAAASDGDTLRVFPGKYSGFTTGVPGGAPGKSLQVVGDVGDPPLVLSEIEVNGATSFTLAGFALTTRNTFRDVQGRVELDQLDIRRLDLIDCDDVVVSRSFISNNGIAFADPAVSIVGGRVAMVDGYVEGRKGGNQFFGCASVDGGPAVVVEGGAEVAIVATDVRGGQSGIGNDQPCCDSEPGPAIVLKDSSRLTLRGASEHTIAKGSYWPGYSCNPPADVEVEGAGTLVWSGVTLDPGEITSQPGASVIPVDPWQPYLYVRGSDVPGTFRRVQVFGPDGEPGLLAMALAPASFTLPGFEGIIGLDLGSVIQLLPVQTMGPASAVTELVKVPTIPALVGETLSFQALFLNVAGALDPSALLLTNPGSMTIRF